MSGKDSLTGEERREFLEGFVAGVVVPGLDVDAVVGLLLEVLRVVVHDQRLGQVSAQLAQVFLVHVLAETAVRPVQPVADQLLGVEAVQNEVRVVF